MSRQMQNFRRGNPQQQGRESNPEEEWRNEIKSSLGEDYVQKVLMFDRLELDKFKEFNDKLKSFIRGRDIGTTRMRKIYEIVNGAKDQRSLLVSLPILAYIVGKEFGKNREEVGKIVTIISDCIYKMKTEEDLKGIKKFTEALVAYHRYFHPRSE